MSREQILVDAIVQARRDLWWFIENFDGDVDYIDDPSRDEIHTRALRIQDEVLGKALDEWGEK